MTYDPTRQSRILEFDKIAQLLADRCMSAEAKDTAAALLPTVDYEQSVSLLAETEAAYRMSVKYGAPSFYGLAVNSDLLLRAAAGGTLNIRELLNVSSCMRIVRLLISYRRDAADTSTVLDGLFNTLTSHRDIEERIEAAVLNEETLCDSASPELAQIRRKMRAAQDSARARLNSIVASQTTSKYLQEPVVMMRDGRFVVPVKVEHRANMPGLVHGVSASGATLFIEPASVVEANNEVRILESKEMAEVERILAELSAMCGGAAESLILSCKAAVKLDLIFARASLGTSMNGFIPDYRNDGIIDIKKARHPLIDGTKVVPVDITLGEAFDSLIITGPNTGGKTVVLKTVGLFCMMASCGMMIPAADNSTVSHFDRILADIGDEQSIEQSLSTFSAHTVNIVSILQEADSNSLVLLDELGAGTDPAEGAALAIAILENLRGKGARIIATTHYAELKQYALVTPRAVNGCCEFDVATLRPTYKLLIGVPGSSNAFAISKRLGVEDAIIERAKEVMDNKTLKLDEVMRTLEEQRSKLEEDREAASTLRRQAEEEKKRHDDELKKLKKNFENELERTRGEQMRIIQYLRMESQKLIDEINALRKADKKDPDALARRAKEQIASRVKELERAADPVRAPQYEEEYVAPRPIVVGDEVIVTGIDKRGKLISLDEKNGKATVDIGIGKVKADISALRLVTSHKKERDTDGHVSYSGVSGKTREVSTSLMIRHMELVEAMPLVEQFIDDCVINHLPTITIIHGKGTGTLKNAVHALLKNHPNVKSYRLGKYGEGENGVTVVELK